MSKKRLLPFGLMPGSWGLSGLTRKIAEAEYYGNEYLAERLRNEYNISDENERHIADIKTSFKYGFISEKDRDLSIADLSGDDVKILETQFRYGVITEGEKEVGIANINGDATRIIETKFRYGLITEKDHDYSIAELRNDAGTWLGVKHKHGEITTNEFLREMATLRGEPYFDVVKMEIDPTNVKHGEYELDWNKIFIEKARSEGYNAPTEEAIAELWFTDFCKNIALSELSGTGVFDENAEESFTLKKKRLNGGKVMCS